MKKLLATLLSLTVMAATIFVLASCKDKNSDGKQDGNENDNTVQNPGEGNNQPSASDDNNTEEKPGGDKNDKNEVNKYSEGLAYISNDDGTCYVRGIGTCTDSKIVIPPVSPEGETVTGVYSVAFRQQTGITSIVLPDTVTTIETGAFFACYDLTSVDLGNGVTSIGLQAFYVCKKLTNILIPDGVTSIGDQAFVGCMALTDIDVDKDNAAYKSFNCSP